MRKPRLVDLEHLPPDFAGAAESLSAQILLDLIRRLQILDRQIILLYLEGEDAAAISEVTGLSANNVATKIHRIKKLLRQWSREGATHA
jgi:RNA polymerase sigma-70 factor (ECF subfamily)